MGLLSLHQDFFSRHFDGYHMRLQAPLRQEGNKTGDCPDKAA